VRQHYLDKYRGLVTTTLPVANGVVPLPEGPGLGVELTPQVFARPDITVEQVEA
jgi:L-alanine-DL-glutamate epimerase-like enolase superfamily enzyme